MTDRGVIRGVVNRDGRLVEADDALAQLNLRAGGAIGAPLAVVQLATLTRLARRLGVLIARGVTVADGAVDLDLWVRAAPHGEGVELALCGWRERQAWRPAPTLAAADPVPAGDDAWAWQTDAALRLTLIALDAGPHFGFDAAALLGAPLTRLFQLTESSAGELPMLQALALRRDFDDQPATIRASGKPVTIAARVRRDAAGGFAGYLGTAAPVTVAAVDDDAPAAAFTERLGTALRGPLARIVANADSINAQADGPLRQDYVDYATDIANAGRHLLDLVDDLADLQAIERADFTVAVEPIDLADIARRAAGLLSVRAANGDVRIDRPDALEKLAATGEFRRVLQILVNLIGNAVRYSPPGATVWIRSAEEDGRALVIVADQGKGIAPEDQARIFEKFERVDPSEPGGNGLGLYIARRLARAMGGDLTVDSTPGQGARFVLALPAG